MEGHMNPNQLTEAKITKWSRMETCQKVNVFWSIGSIASPSPSPSGTTQPHYQSLMTGLEEERRPNELHSLEDGVCVQVHAAHIRRRVIQVKIAGVQSYDEGAGGAQHISQGQWTQRDVRARPVEGENHLRMTAGEKKRSWKKVRGQSHLIHWLIDQQRRGVTKYMYFVTVLDFSCICITSCSNHSNFTKHISEFIWFTNDQCNAARGSNSGISSGGTAMKCKYFVKYCK